LLPPFWIVPVLLGIGATPLAAQVRHEYSEVHMGMAVRIVLHAPDDRAARAGARAAFDRIATLERILTDYRPQSELRRLQERTRQWVPVSAELFAVLDRALDLARATDGAFDPTVGPLVGLWRAARTSGRLPGPAPLDSARALVGWRHLALDTTRRAARLALPGMRLDLGAVAKGFILQDALRVLRERGLRSALLEAGGDIVVGDAPPGRDGWRIETPGADHAFAARAAALVNAALATSGPAAQFVEIEGVRYSHVVDPRTGLGLTNGITARVIAPDAATADALATAFSVLGPGASFDPDMGFVVDLVGGG
jgi:thiamine biosynthesis lipoprotein